MGIMYYATFLKKNTVGNVENLTIFAGSRQFSRVGTMGLSKQRRAASERLKNRFRCTNSGQFVGKDDEEKETDSDQMCMTSLPYLLHCTAFHYHKLHQLRNRQ